MKNISVLFASEKSSFLFEKAFDGKSAFEKSFEWASSVSEKVYVFADENVAKNVASFSDKISIVSESDWTNLKLVQKLDECCRNEQADSALFSWADCPFLNKNLTEEIVKTHNEYKAEYTYSDGYPYGFAPEMINGGVAAILSNLCSTTQKETGLKAVTRTSLFDILKTDINSFEIETVLSDSDWRLFRFSFTCDNILNFTACKNLHKAGITEKSVEEIADFASKNKDILKTVPSYFNIQIADSQTQTCMKSSDFNSLFDKISAFTDSAVINLTFTTDLENQDRSEPFANPELTQIVEKILSHKGFSVFIETDGLNVSETTAGELKKIAEKSEKRTNGYEKIMFAVKLDAVTSKMFSQIRKQPEQNFEKALNAVNLLAKSFPSSVYPQFIRSTDNECELEAFFRYWSDKSNVTGGNLIIQKYNSFCGRLPEKKSADLSPVERNVCWKLRRDMSILINGDVVLCPNNTEITAGNAFTQNLSEIWQKMDGELLKHIAAEYSENCGRCDEYYTFNF